MKNIAALLTVFSVALAPAVKAENYDFARVTSVTPVYESVTQRIPQQECWMESVQVNRPEQHPAAGTIVGGVIGGALGHAVGHGKRNKKMGAVVGTMIGMTVGNNMSKRRPQHAEYREFERCETHYVTTTEERFSGYDVTYSYHGKRYTTHTQQHPGDRIRVAVHVRPVMGE